MPDVALTTAVMASESCAGALVASDVANKSAPLGDEACEVCDVVGADDGGGGGGTSMVLGLSGVFGASSDACSSSCGPRRLLLLLGSSKEAGRAALPASC